MPSATHRRVLDSAGSRRKAGPEPLRRKRLASAPPSSRRRKTVKFVLLFAAAILVVDALVGQKGLLETLRAEHQAGDGAAALARLRQENAMLREEARRLREDPGALEALAREELGLIRPGEILFILKDKK